MSRPHTHRLPAAISLAALGALTAAGTAAAATPLTFVRQDYPTFVTQGIGLATGDFNGDDLPDLAVAGWDGNAALLLNTGSGLVSGPPHPIGVGGLPFWTSAVDWDDDGSLDVVIADLFASELFLIRGDGAGNLLPPTQLIPVGNSPIHVTVVDLDLDSRDDLVVSNSASPFISVLYGGGPRLDLPALDASHTTAVRDFDRDGRNDIAISFSDLAETVGIIRATGPRTFAAMTTVGSNLGYHMDAGDFNGDGFFDLVTAPLFGNDVFWLMGHGDGTFSTFPVDFAGGNQNDVRAEDINCDGLDDAVVVGGFVSIVLAGDPALGLVRVATPSSGPGSDTAAIADYDGDGVKDVAFPNNQTGFAGQVAVLYHTTVLLSCPPDQSIDPGPACVVDLAATSCDHTLTISSQPPLPSAPAPGTTTVVFTALDPAGATATCSTQLTVLDTTAPVIAGVPPDLTVPCPEVPPPAMPTLTDCDPAATLSFGEVRIDGACLDSYDLVRTWTASDSSGNTATASQTVSVVDLVAPVLSGCGLAPAAPPGPASSLASPLPPAAPASPCSAASSAWVRIECGQASDACDPDPVVAAELVLSRHVVVAGTCQLETETVAAGCGELIELVRLAPPCPARPPRSPRPPVSVRSDGLRVIAFEELRLEVKALDRCGNLSAPCIVAAAGPGGPLPCAPAPPRCPVSACAAP